VEHSRAKWPERPQLKHVWPEAAPVVGGAGRRSTGGGGGRALGPAGADAEVDEEPTAAADAGVDAAVADEVGRWNRGGMLSGTLEEHFQTELAQPFSSWFPCGRRLHHPRL
jgi:hypothetical protein